MRASIPTFNSNRDLLLQLSAEIASRGYGRNVIEAALVRKGAPHDIAQLIAATATSCRAAILAVQAPCNVTAGHSAADEHGNVDHRSARAAQLALSKMASFLLLVCVGFGAGVALGWSVGFGQGLEDGLDWVARAVASLTGH